MTAHTLGVYESREAAEEALRQYSLAVGGLGNLRAYKLYVRRIRGTRHHWCLCMEKR